MACPGRFGTKVKLTFKGKILLDHETLTQLPAAGAEVDLVLEEWQWAEEEKSAMRDARSGNSFFFWWVRPCSGRDLIFYKPVFDVLKSVFSW